MEMQTATAHNVAASGALFRLSIVAQLICQAGFIFGHGSVRSP
jgi:hypothetical protein